MTLPILAREGRCPYRPRPRLPAAASFQVYLASVRQCEYPQPLLAWSPDGCWLPAEHNTFLIDSQSGEKWQWNDNGGFGAIAWVAALR